MCRGVIFTIFIFSRILGQVQYNHPELNWHTFETDHFMVHFHDESEMTAREAATVAEIIYSKVTDLYEYKPPQKTHLVLIDTDDISIGTTENIEDTPSILSTATPTCSIESILNGL